MKIDTGIGPKERAAVAEGLSRVLADSYTLYLKTHSFHWNVTGPLFPSLHLLFEQQYTELALAVDLVAERIRALDLPAPGSYTRFAALATVREETGVPAAAEMVRQLALDHETVVRTIRAALPAAEKAGDEASLELLVGRMGAHEKAAWMLRSSAG